MEITLNKDSIPFPIYVTPFYFKHQPIDEVHFLVELHNGDAFCCKWLTIEKTWVETLMGGFPVDLIEKVYDGIRTVNIVELLKEAVNIEEL